MIDQFTTSDPTTYEDTTAFTSLPGSADGTWPSISPDGTQLDLFGQEAAPASPSASPRKASGTRLEIGRVEQTRDQCAPVERGGGVGDPWSEAAWVACKDGKARPVEPGTEPLADGVPARVAKLRAYGNAVVPQVAAAFIRAAAM